MLTTVGTSRSKQFDIDKYQERVFGMYSGEVVEVTLRVNERVIMLGV